MNQLNFSLNLTGFTNPPSLAPTSSFTFSTYGPNAQVNYITSGLILTMLTPATSNSFSMSLSNRTVSTFAAYTLSITFKIPHTTN